MPEPRDTSPPDLTTATGFFFRRSALSQSERRSVLIQPDHLLILSHTYTKDRIERVAYDRVDYAVMRASFPVARMVVWGIVWGGLALVFLIGALRAGSHLHAADAATHAGEIIGALLVAALGCVPLLLCIIRAVRMRNIELTLVRGGAPRTMTIYASKKKAAAAYEKLTAAIRAEQARLAAQAA